VATSPLAEPDDCLPQRPPVGPGRRAPPRATIVAAALGKYRDLGVTHFVLSDTPYLRESTRVGDQLLPLLRRGQPGAAR
jgi:hypothetical protein